MGPTLCLLASLALQTGLAEAGRAKFRPEPARVRTLDGRTSVVGSMSFDGRSLQTDQRKFTVDQLLRIEFTDRRVLQPRTLVLLTNDDRLAMNVDAIDDESVRGQRADGTRTAVPLEFVTAIVFQLPEVRSARQRRLAHAAAAKGQDLIGLQNGDSISGEFLQLVDQSIRLDTRTGQREVPIENVHLLRFNSELLSQVPIPDTPAALLQFRDGTILTGSGLRPVESGRLSFQAAAGPTIELSGPDLFAIQVLNPKAGYLSQTPSVKQQLTPFMNGTPAVRMNQNIRGGPLSHRGVRHVRGIGTTSRSELIWDIPQDAATFHSQIGLDDTATSGAAVFVVTLDGDVVYRSPIVRAADGLLDIPPISVAGHERISLVVDYGPRGDIQDVASWIQPVFVLR